LIRCHDRFDITGQPSLPNASWVDYFAVLALAYVNAACEELAYRRSETRWNLNVDADARALAIFLMGQYAVIAMEAVCVAESFRRQEIAEKRTAEKTETEHSEKISLRMQKAAIARHGPTNALISECHQLWLELKKRGGAKTIPEDRVSHLFPENRIYVLARGISQYEKGKRKLKTTPPD
jgi:hypothetical protein